MSNLFKLLVILNTIYPTITQACYLAKEHPDFPKIREERDKILKKPSSPEMTEKPQFGPKITELCPNIDQTFIRTSERDERGLLGSGSYGTVFTIDLGKGVRAVKYNSFDKFMGSKINAHHADAQEKVRNNCIKSVLTNKREEIFIQEQKIIDKADPEKPAEYVRKQFLTELTPINLNLLDTKECDLIEDGNEDVQEFFQDFFDTVRREKEDGQFLTNEAIKDEENKVKTLFSKFDFCIVDESFDVCFVMQKLDYTLKEVVKNAQMPFFQKIKGKESRFTCKSHMN